MNINFAFIRHGYGCHNAMGNLVRGKVVSLEHARAFTDSSASSNSNKSKTQLTPMIDPVLTPMGVDASVNNGCVVSKVIRSLAKVTAKDRLQMDTVNIVGCSPLIRCMETAYYMSRKWDNPPNKIYVFPLLREIDEGSADKYSPKSIHTMNTVTSYAMRPINEQKAYLKRIGILDYFDFTFVEKFPEQRMEPGDVKQFLIWFGKYFMPYIKSRQQLNVFVTTHAGVLRDFSHEGFVNNSGFVLNTTYYDDIQRFSFGDYVSLNDYLPKWFFSDFANAEYNTREYYCPSDRCEELCTVAQGPSSGKRSQVKLMCDGSDSTQKTSKTSKTGAPNAPVAIRKPRKESLSKDTISSPWDF